MQSVDQLKSQQNLLFISLPDETDSNRYPVNSGLYMSSKTQAFVNKLLFPPYNRK